MESTAMDSGARPGVQDSRFRVLVAIGGERGKSFSYGNEDAAKECATAYRNAGYRVHCFFPRVGLR